MKRLNEREIIDLFTSYINDPLLDKVKGDDVVIVPLKYDMIKRMNKTGRMNIVLKSDMLIESTRCTRNYETLANSKKEYNSMRK